MHLLNGSENEIDKTGFDQHRSIRCFTLGYYADVSFEYGY
jgi:hypothetical protein